MVIALGTIPIAHAQNINGLEVQNQSAKLEEVVVTSRRREEKLQDVSLTVFAFSAAKLETLAITDKASLFSVAYLP